VNPVVCLSSDPGGNVLDLYARTIDPSDYPSGATFSATWSMWSNTGGPDGSACARLYDLDVQAPVAGASHCQQTGSGAPTETFVSAPLALSAAHHYVMQLQLIPDPVSCGCGPYTDIADTQFVVRW
jgi:hypothetical protein